MDIKIVRANYDDMQHKKDIPYLLNAYACDPMGGGKALSEDVMQNLVVELSKLPYALSVLAYVDNQPAALVNCFEGFSTFACKPLLNIHDICVLKNYRGIGLSQKLLKEVECIAKERGCCKITLEVLSNNSVAQLAYKKFGFSSYELDPQAGSALFWQKTLR